MNQKTLRYSLFGGIILLSILELYFIYYSMTTYKGIHDIEGFIAVVFITVYSWHRMLFKKDGINNYRVRLAGVIGITILVPLLLILIRPN